MPIEQLTPQGEIDAYLEIIIERANKAVIYNLKYVGEQIINHARSLPSPSASAFKGKRIPPHKPNYMDWTANLRSSIGYVIVRDGKVIEQGGFIPEKRGQEGAKSGLKFAKEIAAQFPEGITLVVVAGMEYAAYVSAKGYDVIDSAELLAEKLVPKMLKRLGFIK